MDDGVLGLHGQFADRIVSITGGDPAVVHLHLTVENTASGGISCLRIAPVECAEVKDLPFPCLKPI